MPKVKEFTVTIEDKPGALGKFFSALGENGINVLAFQSYVEGRESLSRLVVDNPVKAKTLLGDLRMIFEETDAISVQVPNQPGELGNAAAKLGQAQVNIDYSYCGVEPGSSEMTLVFGVDSLTKGAKALDA